MLHNNSEPRLYSKLGVTSANQILDQIRQHKRQDNRRNRPREKRDLGRPMASRKRSRALRHEISVRSIHGGWPFHMKIGELKKVLIIGSGAIKIGEAGEFDYSTSQAIKALREEGIQTVVVNPNIATIHTDKKFADKVYSVPIRTEFIEQIIEEEKPDGILLGFGGQTALNCGVELSEKGILEKHGLRVLGTSIRSIELADNRELFKTTMQENGIPVPKSRKASDLDSAIAAAKEIGNPVIVRVAYTLGGQGSGVAFDETKLKEIARRGLAYSRISQILVEEYLDKWKEVEYEVMRDQDDNCTIVCNMENLDPMGIPIGDTLPELTNKITGVTSACFEPSLDYIVVKAPRWDFQKFRNASNGIGTQMKSVGEVMAIGRCFAEALQKAVRMLDQGRELTEVRDLGRSPDRIRKELSQPTDQRICYTVKALKSGLSIEEVSKLSGIDPWFLDKIRNILLMEDRITNERLIADTIRDAKILGFSDARIARLIGKTTHDIREFRKSKGIVPFTKQIDTLAAEWPTNTNYLYMTYGGNEDDLTYSEKDRIVVLGSGCYRIGSSVEFDWCCVNMALALKSPTREVIMINCNPETVSTDFDVLDKLYFEELTEERVLDIIDKERPAGVVVSVGGQTANNLTVGLAKHARILGTSPTSIDTAEDRSKFGQLLDKLRVQQPEWSRVKNLGDAKKFADGIGYPVLIRPSYVLSGAAMNVAFDEAQLTEYIEQAAKISRDYPVVISKFLSGAREVEVDGVCDGTNVFIGALVEHVENAGVHSGDATMRIPTLTIGEATKQRILRYSEMIAQSLLIKGPFNIQFLVKNGEVQVIECNLRASRSMPFVSKMIGMNLMDLAAIAIMGGTIESGEGTSTGFGVKAPQFSFTRLDNADPITGVEMVSTGEVACFGKTFQDAFINALIASNFYVPRKGDAVLISMGETRKGIIPYARMLAENGYRIYATRHTAEELAQKGIESTILYKVRERRKPNILDYLTSKEIKLVINIPSHEREAESRLILRDEYVIRRKAAEFGIPVVTNLELVRALVRALISFNNKTGPHDLFKSKEKPSVESSMSSPPSERDTEGRNALKPIPITPAA